MFWLQVSLSFGGGFKMYFLFSVITDKVSEIDSDADMDFCA